MTWVLAFSVAGYWSHQGILAGHPVPEVLFCAPHGENATEQDPITASRHCCETRMSDV